MISPKDFVEKLVERGIGFFAGVPDSLLKQLFEGIEQTVKPEKHVITANEGNAVAVALGYYLSTGDVAVVYMQNSGLGNAINPLTSLMDPEVYRVPVILIVGWRGEPNVPDEPQHIKQGRITPSQLALLGIPYWVLDENSDPEQILDDLFFTLRSTNAPVAILVRKNSFSRQSPRMKHRRTATLLREDALERVIELARNALVISTTGKTSRELFELRAARNEEQRDFLTVGGMGHASSIALGVSLGCLDRGDSRLIVCLDGDGAMLMHLGAVAIIGEIKPGNFVHVLLNNSAHESVGGQPTVADRLDLEALALACGYGSYMRARNIQEIDHCWSSLHSTAKPVFFEIEIAIGSRSDLGRPSSAPEQNKRSFMDAVG